MKITLLYGGQSAEHEVSILSAFSVLNAIYYDYYQVQLVYITKNGQWVKGPLLAQKPESQEVLHLTWEGEGKTGQIINPGAIKEEGTIVFPLLHGPNGEDGTIQGFLETLKMPYVGTGVLASACSMDKIMTKYVLQSGGIPQVPYVPVLAMQWKQNPQLIFEQCEGSLLYPMFVKPANLGSSVGISKAENREELEAALNEAFLYDTRVIIEQGIEAREIEVAVLGNEDVRTTMAGEIVKDVAFYDYHSKYIDNKIVMQIPAEVPDEVVAPYGADKTKKLLRGPRYKALENPIETLYRVRYFDLDMNGHVNNSKYLEWMLDVFDLDFLTKYTPAHIDLKYVKEIHHGSEIYSGYEFDQESLSSQHQICVDGNIHAQAIIQWKEIGEE